MKEKESQLPFEALTRGYILIPKLLLEKRLANQQRSMSELEAMLTVLTKVNYKDAICRVNGQDILCKRGESLYSMDTWAELLHWKRGKTRLFFNSLCEEGVLEFLADTSHRTTHVRVKNYNLWTGCHYEAMQTKRAQEDERFEVFWTTFHSITKQPKTNRGRAEREWRKLTPEEQLLAMQQIEHYFFDTVRDTRYCQQASSYLSNKAFLNE